MDKLQLGEKLVKEGHISPVQLQVALREQARTGTLLGEVLCNLGYVSKETIKRVLAEDAGIEFVSLNETKINRETLKLVPRAFALRHKILPLEVKNGTLRVVMSDVFDLKTIDELQATTEYFVQPVSTSDEELNQALDRYYGTEVKTSPQIPLNQQEIDVLARELARKDSTILIFGERCSSKELLAQDIHSQSPRSGGPFVKVNCQGNTQLEYELFGVEEEGFFQRSQGKLELASGGVLFLEEILDVPLFLFIKVLRVLKTREFERIGSIITRRTDARLIATTSRDLHQAVKWGIFDKELYFKLNITTVELPPLRERRADVLYWTETLLKKIGRKLGKPNLRVSGDTLRALMVYNWPGNLTELEDCLERAATLASGEMITRNCLPF